MTSKIHVHAGLTSTALGLLEAWVAAHATRLSALKGLSETDVEPIPRWVDALLLVLNSCTHIDWQAPSADAASKGPQAGATTSAAPQAEQARLLFAVDENVQICHIAPLDGVAQ